MLELKHKLLTNKYKKIYYEDKQDTSFNAPHHFEVFADRGESRLQIRVCKVDFQKGPIEEHGVNGVTNEDLIAMVICRLEHFNQHTETYIASLLGDEVAQITECGCRETKIAIAKLEEALVWLRERTLGRGARGVAGTDIV